MTDPKPDHYDIEPSSGSDEAPSVPPSTEGSAKLPPLPLEPVPLEGEPAIRQGQPMGSHSHASSIETSTTGRPSVKSLDVCPNCGEPMRGADVLVCLRCGFDLKTLKVVKTVTGPPTVAAAAEEEEEFEPLVRPGMGDLWLPGALAAISGVILAVGYLAGVEGLFHIVRDAAQPAISAAEPIKAGVRFEGLLRFIVLVSMWTGCGLGALAFLAYLQGDKFGDFKLAVVRILGIVMTMRLVSLIHFKQPWLEWTIEAVLQAGAFVGLSMVLFSLKPRDVPTYAGAAVISFMFLWLGANVVVWVTG